MYSAYSVWVQITGVVTITSEGHTTWTYSQILSSSFGVADLQKSQCISHVMSLMRRRCVISIWFVVSSAWSECVVALRHAHSRIVNHRVCGWSAFYCMPSTFLLWRQKRVWLYLFGSFQALQSDWHRNSVCLYCTVQVWASVEGKNKVDVTKLIMTTQTGRKIDIGTGGGGRGGGGRVIDVEARVN